MKELGLDLPKSSEIINYQVIGVTAVRVLDPL